MKTRNQNRGYEIAARLMDNYEGKQDMDSNTWNDLVVRVGDAINLEVDVLAKYVERLLNASESGKGTLLSTLARSGFLD